MKINNTNFSVFIASSKLTAVNHDLIHESEFTNLNNDIIFKSITVKIKQFSHIKIFINKTDKSAENIFTKKVKTFLYIKISKKKQKNDNNKKDSDELLHKILKVMLTLTVFTTDEEDFNNV